MLFNLSFHKTVSAHVAAISRPRENWEGYKDYTEKFAYLGTVGLMKSDPKSPPHYLHSRPAFRM